MTISLCNINTTTTSFGARLKLRRKLLKISQEDVGVAIGLDESCSRVRISRYETGVHEPNLATLKKLAATLKAPPEYFYCERNSVAELILVAHNFPDEQIEILVKKFLLLHK